MQPFKTLSLSSLILVFTNSNAFAFNFGFVRAPDWMDNYFLVLLAIAISAMVITAATKPSHVPFNQLYRTKVEPLPTLFFRIFQISAVIVLAMLFIGMGLARMG